MGQTNPMDRVIRHVNNTVEATGPSEKIVVFDVDNCRVVEKKSFFSTLLIEVRHYLVCNSLDPRNEAQGQITGYTLQSVDHSLPVSVTYRVSCRPGNEARATAALYDPTLSPGEQLERHITRWLTETGQSDIPEFISSYLEDRAAVEAKIAAKALAETGLDLRLRLSLDWEPTLTAIPINKDHLRALVQDYQDEAQDLGIRATLEIDERGKRNAILQYRRRQSLQDDVPHEVLRFIRQHVTLQQFPGLNTPALRQRVVEHLDAYLAQYGRKVGTLRLIPGEVPPGTFHQGKSAITIRLHEYPHDVVIHAKVQMLRKDIAQYKAAGSPNLDEWLAKQLDRYVKQYLFGAKYLDVLIGFDEYETRIKRTLADEAGSIGYQIEQLITGPDLEPIKWRDPFPLTVPSTSFETRFSQFFVSLQFNVIARIPRLETVREYLNRDQHVPRLMETEIAHVARQHLHTVDPERFYMRFNTPGPDEKTTVEQELDARIRQRLKKKFGAEVLDVVAKIAETELITLLKSLIATIRPFSVEMKSLHGGEPVLFRGDFFVDSVDQNGWQKFQMRPITIEILQEQIEQHLFSMLRVLPPAEIQFRSLEAQKRMQEVIAGLAMRYVCDQFGLVIQVTNVRRESTQHEIAVSQHLLADNARVLHVESVRRDDWAGSQIMDSHDLRAQLEQLQARRRLLIAESGTKDELDEINAMIDKLTAALVPKDLPALAEVRLSVLPPADQASTLLDLARMENIELKAGGAPALARPEQKALGGDAE